MLHISSEKRIELRQTTVSMMILPGDEHQPSKNNTVTIVVIEQSKREVLLLQRNPDAYPNVPDPFPRAWELIGGSVEDGEKPDVAAHRELWEETSIAIPSLTLVGVSPYLSKGIRRPFQNGGN